MSHKLGRYSRGRPPPPPPMGVLMSNLLHSNNNNHQLNSTSLIPEPANQRCRQLKTKVYIHTERISQSRCRIQHEEIITKKTAFKLFRISCQKLSIFPNNLLYEDSTKSPRPHPQWLDCGDWRHGANETRLFHRDVVKLTHGENVVFVEIHDSKITNFASVSMAAGSKQGAEHDESKQCRELCIHHRTPRNLLNGVL